MQNNSDRDRKASIIAASITFGAALIILVLLFVLNIGGDRRMLSETSIPEIQDDEEIFLDPELLIVEHRGEEDAEEKIPEAARQPMGEPDPAPEEQPVKVVKNSEPPNEEPVTNKSKLVSTEKPADVKTSTPKVSEEDEKRIASVSGKFKTDNNGSNTSHEESTGTVVASGKLSGKGSNGRSMLSCPRQTVKASQKVTIVVQITVDAKGNVKSARVTSGGSSEQRARCEQMALRSKWTPQPDAADETGTITFTINPR